MSRTLNRYVHRATLGLPRNERLEMAAELRTHLMDKTKLLEAEGFTREEAEHLAVKAMGHVNVTNRELLGHILNHTAGWLVLTGILIGGAWWAWQHLPLPSLSAPFMHWDTTLSNNDLKFLQQDAGAVRAPYLAGTLRIPARTQWLYVTVLSTKSERMELSVRNIQYRQPADRRAVLNGSLKGRVLLSVNPWSAQCPLLNGKPQMQMYAQLLSNEGDLGSLQVNGTNGCSGRLLPLTLRDTGYATSWTPRHQGSLPLNQWTVLASYTATPPGRLQNSEAQPDIILAVMPASTRQHHQDSRTTASLTQGAGVTMIGESWKDSGLGLPNPTKALKQ